MEVLSLLIVVSVLLVGGIIAALVWAVDSGQFDDPEGAAYLIFDDDEIEQISNAQRDGADPGTRSDQR